MCFHGLPSPRQCVYLAVPLRYADDWIAEAKTALALPRAGQGPPGGFVIATAVTDNLATQHDSSFALAERAVGAAAAAAVGAAGLVGAAEVWWGEYWNRRQVIVFRCLSLFIHCLFHCLSLQPDRAAVPAGYPTGMERSELRECCNSFSASAFRRVSTMPIALLLQSALR